MVLELEADRLAAARAGGACCGPARGDRPGSGAGGGAARRGRRGRSHRSSRCRSGSRSGSTSPRWAATTAPSNRPAEAGRRVGRQHEMAERHPPRRRDRAAVPHLQLGEQHQHETVPAVARLPAEAQAPARRTAVRPAPGLSVPAAPTARAQMKGRRRSRSMAARAMRSSSANTGSPSSSTTPSTQPSPSSSPPAGDAIGQLVGLDDRRRPRRPARCRTAGAQASRRSRTRSDPSMPSGSRGLRLEPVGGHEQTRHQLEGHLVLVDGRSSSAGRASGYSTSSSSASTAASSWPPRPARRRPPSGSAGGRHRAGRRAAGGRLATTRPARTPARRPRHPRLDQLRRPSSSASCASPASGRGGSNVSPGIVGRGVVEPPGPDDTWLRGLDLVEQSIHRRLVIEVHDEVGAVPAVRDAGLGHRLRGRRLQAERPHAKLVHHLLVLREAEGVGRVSEGHERHTAGGAPLDPTRVVGAADRADAGAHRCHRRRPATWPTENRPQKIAGHPPAVALHR